MGFRRIAALSLVLGLAACAAPPPPPPPATPPDTRAADEAAIRAASKAWSAAAQAKDVQKFIAYYAEDAKVLLEGGPDLNGMAAIREGMTGMMGDPNFALSFQTEQVTVARSGDVAYETGTHSLTLTGPNKKPVSSAGHFVVVWRKQADGSWKAAVDAPVSDPRVGPVS